MDVNRLYVPGPLIVIKGTEEDDIVVVEIWRGTILGRELLVRRRVPREDLGDLGDPKAVQNLLNWLQAMEKP